MPAASADEGGAPRAKPSSGNSPGPRPISAFDHNLVLPPHLGDPRDRGDLSPYPATSLEVCQRWSVSAGRRQILTGWVKFRCALTVLGITDGFQWLDGSFMEDVEAREARSPNDLDLLTFYSLPAGEAPREFLQRTHDALPHFFDPFLSRRDYFVEHFPIHLGSAGATLVDHTRYFRALLTPGRWHLERNAPG